MFDLLHVGHVSLLEAARGLGQALVVGVNGDVSARSLGKGIGRPFVPEAERARLVAALACTDCVVIFEEATPLELIRALHPDVLVKGADYERSQIVGAQDVEAWGGRVVRIPLVPERSTTALVRRLAGASELLPPPPSG